MGEQLKTRPPAFEPQVLVDNDVASSAKLASSIYMKPCDPLC